MNSGIAMGRRFLSLRTTSPRQLGLGKGGDSTNNDMDVVGCGRSGASPSSSTSDSSQVPWKLGDESGDIGDGIGSTWLDVRDGEWAVIGGAERGERCEVGKARPAAAGLE